MSEEQDRGTRAIIAVLRQAVRQRRLPPSVAPKRVLGVPEFARIPDHAWTSRVPDVLLIALFLLAISTPAVAYLFHWQSGLSLGENRNLAKPPAFGQDPMALLPGKIDAYYNDYFGFRKQLIHANSVIRQKWLGMSTRNIVIGKDRWLFLTEDGLVLDDFLGLSPFTLGQVTAWKNYLEDRRKALAERGVRYLFVVAPDKWFIYPEKLPDPIRSKAGQPRIDQLLRFLEATHSPVEILDLRDVLIKAKTQGEVFFRQDTHWNGRGHFAAYLEICRRLQKWFPEIQPQSVGKDYEFRTLAWGAGEWNNFGLPEENLHYPSIFAFKKGTQTAREVPVHLPPGIIPDLPTDRPVEMAEAHGVHRLLLLHDSYMSTGFPDHKEFPFSQHFADSLYIGQYRLNMKALLATVEYQHPDVVIEEWVQRRIVGKPLGYEAIEPLLPGVSPLLTLNSRPSASVLDNINAVNGPLAVPSIHVPGDETIVFTGWAVDEPSKTLASAVDIAIDQTAYGATYGIERKDVAAHFHNPVVRNSGFRLDLPAKTLPKGPHVVTVRTISNDGKSYYVGPPIKFTVD